MIRAHPESELAPERPGEGVAWDLLARKVGAEALGTFALVFAGCGAIMTNSVSQGAVTHAGIAATFGLVIMAMIYSTGHISGAHFNPAVTLAFAGIGRFPWGQVPAYLAGQIGGATAASLALWGILGPVADMGATLPAGGSGQSLALESLLSFLLMFVITSVATDSRAVGQMAGWAIGGTVALAALFAGPISGASMNPARSLGPALVAGTLEHVWIYVVGPILGAWLGAWSYRGLRCGDEGRDAAGCC